MEGFSWTGGRWDTLTSWTGAFWAGARTTLVERRFWPPRWPNPCPATPMGFRPAGVVSGPPPGSLGRLRGGRLVTTTPVAVAEDDEPALVIRGGHPPIEEGSDTDNAWAMAVFARPSAAISSARALTTSRCGADEDRATDSRTSRCPGDTNRAGTGGRMNRIIPTNRRLFTGHPTSDPSCSCLYPKANPRARAGGLLPDPLNLCGCSAGFQVGDQADVDGFVDEVVLGAQQIPHVAVVVLLVGGRDGPSLSRSSRSAQMPSVLM